MANRAPPHALARIASTPQGDGWALVEHPTHSKRQDRFTEPFVRDPFQLVDRSQILTEALTLEFQIDFAQIVAVEFGIRSHSSAQKTTTERAVAQDSKSCTYGIGQHIRLDCTLKQIVRRLHGVELGVSAEHTHLSRRKIADADRPKSCPRGASLPTSARSPQSASRSLANAPGKGR